MATRTKLAAGAPFPTVTFPDVRGGEIAVGGDGRWRMLVVYRGKHCPICKTYLKTLDGLLDEFRAADIEVVAVSGDPPERAAADVAEQGWRFPVGCSLTLDQMRALGLYISHPRTPPETDRPFSEPGVFVVNPDGRVQVIDISNAPYARPDLAMMLKGIKSTREKGFPIRGTAD